jgi:methionine synthase II (cobalamin-independent)
MKEIVIDRRQQKERERESKGCSQSKTCYFLKIIYYLVLVEHASVGPQCGLKTLSPDTKQRAVSAPRTLVPGLYKITVCHRNTVGGYKLIM